MLKNLIRIGKVSSIDAAKGTVRVTLEDQQDIVSNDLPMMAFEYYMPKVNDLVLCLFLGNGISQGFCLGRYFNEIDRPPVTNEKIYCRDFGDGTSIQYNKESKELAITTVGDLKLTVGGDLTIDVAGSLAETVVGDITVTSDNNITTVAGNVNTDISHTRLPEPPTPVTHHP